MNSSPALWILTINDDTNYGNRLQNYALQQLLSDYVPCAATLWCGSQPSASAVSVLKDMLRPLKRFVRDHHGTAGPLMKARQEAFQAFTHQFVDNTLLTLSPERGYSRALTEDDWFVIGSDQVWNDQWLSQEMLRLRLGSECPDGHVISYAASFGVDQVKSESEHVFAELLPRLSAISVREDRGVELVKELSGEEATVVLDPTLMLTADQWRTIIPDDFVGSGEKYVLTYFLGKPSPEQERVIQQYANAHGCQVRRMLDFDDPRTYVAGPREFVELFSKAQYVFTDSYHACCFSILFNKQFKVFNRAGFSGKANMNSRMTTLFRLFELNDFMGDDAKLYTVDYSRVNALLKQHRVKSRSWLESALTTIGAIA